ncbi:MAG: putative regulatory protein phosphatase [Streptomyces oryziradicis]|nr:putative regulatory protein phosphatase [Actinacidiphila oryziradicis]
MSQPQAERLRLLASVSGGMSDTEVLRLGLQQAVAELGGMGGMAHFRRPVSLVLKLVVSSGLPHSFARAWAEVGPDEEVAPARAVREGRSAWVPVRNSSLIAPSLGTGMVAVPLSVSPGPLGALTVLTATPEAPTPEQCSFLEAVARWAVERLRTSADQRRPPPSRRPERRPDANFQSALKAVDVGSFEWNLRTRELCLDDRALAVFGIDADDHLERFEAWSSAVHAEDLPRVHAAAEESIRTGSLLSVEYRVIRPDGTFGWAEARGQVILDEDGEPLHMIGTVWDTTETRVDRDSIGRALRHMSDGFLATDASWRITFLNAEAERRLGSSRKLLGRLLWDAFSDAGVPDLHERYRQAAAEDTPIGFDVRWAADQRWSHMRLVPVPDGAMVYLTDVTERRALDAQRKAAEQSAAERSARIGELTLALSEAVTGRDVVAVVADRVMQPFGATGLTVTVTEGDKMSAVGAVGYPQEFLDAVPALSLSGKEPVPETLHERAPVFIPSAEAYIERYPSLAHMPALGDKQAWAFLPMVASGRAIGVTVVSFSQPHHFTDEERTLLTAVSGLMGQALARARLYDTEHSRAQELQRGLLPRELPPLPAVTAAACYLPAGEGIEVGGDWYDIIPLSADRVALVIGDVMGHGVSEAATMGRLRTAVDTLADLDLPPDELLTHLNDLVSNLGDDFYATCLYAVYDPSTATCAFASAGHPPPAVVHPDGTVHFPRTAPNAPLGTAVLPFETVELDLPDGSLLALYTDGLVESPARDIDHGMDQLAQALTNALGATPHRSRNGTRSGAQDTERLAGLCDAVAAALVPAQQLTSDDAALLIARTHTLAPGDVASWSLPEDPQAAGQAREHIRSQLTAWDLDELTMTTELLGSELVGNVVRHAKGPIRLRLLRSRALTCEVSDGSVTTPRIRHASDTDEGGRGLQLVAALAHRWGTRYTTTGKCIWTEQPLPVTADT